MKIATNHYKWKGENLVLNLKLQTNADKNGVAGELNGYLKITITSQPIEGKANENLIIFLAKHFGTAKNQVKIIILKTVVANSLSV